MTERRITRMAVRPASWHQAGILVNDGSPSMLDPIDAEGGPGTSKAQAVATATTGLIRRLEQSRNKANFSLAGVEFHSGLGRVWGPELVTNIDPNRDYDPTLSGGEGTSIAAGLSAAEQMIQGFFASKDDGLRSSCVILVCSDGQCFTPDETRVVANRLKGDARIRIACAYFSTHGQPNLGLSLLEEICSSPASQHCTLVHDAETLRRFWEATMMSAAALPALPPARSA